MLTHRYAVLLLLVSGCLDPRETTSAAIPSPGKYLNANGYVVAVFNSPEPMSRESAPSLFAISKDEKEHVSVGVTRTSRTTWRGLPLRYCQMTATAIHAENRIGWRIAFAPLTDGGCGNIPMDAGGDYFQPAAVAIKTLPIA